MLILNNVGISVQDFGTRYAVFLTGQNKDDIQARYYSFWNWKVTSGELNWWCDNCAFFWVEDNKMLAEMRILDGLKQMTLTEMLAAADKRKKKQDPWPIACQTAQERFNKIERVTWMKSGFEVNLFGMGNSVKAERGTGNFDDDVLGSVLTRNGKETLEMVKAAHSDGESETDDEQPPAENEQR